MRLIEVALKKALSSVKTLSPVDLAMKHGIKLKTIEQQLKAGIKHELEHTTDHMVAREIALDHLKEDPFYYKKLDSVMKKHVD